MPEFKVVGGTVSDAIHFFEQAFHITFPVQAPSGGSIGNSPGASAGTPAAGQDLGQPIQEHLPQGSFDGHASSGNDATPTVIEAIIERHAHDGPAAADDGAHWPHWSDIA